MNKYKFFGFLLHLFYKGLSKLIKKEYYYFNNDETVIESQNIIAFWHRKIFTVCNATKKITKKASIVSASNDGEILSEMLRREGNELIRGSSNRDNIKSLKEALTFIKKKYTIGIAVDGPKGPIYEPKPGVVYLAQKTGISIIPIGSYCNKKWIFEKMWDKLEIPKPFSKNIHYFGEKFIIDKTETIEEGIEKVKNKINESNEKAYKIYIEKYRK